jgi:hypothetical protein
MLSAVKRLRVPLLTGALILGSAGSALAATSWSAPAASPNGQSVAVVPAPTPDPSDLQAPDCLGSCSKLLQPGQRLVVAAPYAFHSVTISAGATGFGAQFKVRWSPNGSSYSLLSGPASGTSFGPVTFTMPGYYRVVVTDPQAELSFSTLASASIKTS